MKHNMHTKYPHLMIRLLGVGGVFGILAWFIRGIARDWLSGISFLAFAAGLTVFLVGIVAERRELEAKRKTETGV
jgi:hypothetical protein